MKNFLLNPAEIYELLRAKGVTNLYHANTVTTAQTFIEEDSLLSRYFVEQHHLEQTAQSTDEMDQTLGLWDDVFLDGFDLHQRSSEPSSFGPVLFVMKLELLLRRDLGELSATRWNPSYWKYHPNWEDRYIMELSELEDHYLAPGVDPARIVFTFTKSERKITLSKFLYQIILDEPYCSIQNGSNTNFIITKQVQSALRSTMDRNGLTDIPLILRHASSVKPTCNCTEQYQKLYTDNLGEFVKRFKPQGYEFDL